MQQLLVDTILALIVFMGLIALFFFALTRGTLLLRTLSSGDRDGTDHIYPIYSNMRLIRLIDYQWIISAILLFHYHRLVAEITTALRRSNLDGKTVLITSCAFGNVIPELVAAALDAGARRILVVDIIENELIHAAGKIRDPDGRVEFVTDDATALQLASGSVDVDIMFFLLHELPHALKRRALDEATRVLAEDGTFYLAEFHRPNTALLRIFGWLYFKVFEPYGLAMWDSEDPLRYFAGAKGWHSTRSTCCQGNYQVLTAARSPAIPVQ